MSGQNAVTLYLGPVEIRKWGQGTAEEILLYPAPNVRITRTNPGGSVVAKVNALHTHLVPQPSRLRMASVPTDVGHGCRRLISACSESRGSHSRPG